MQRAGHIMRRSEGVPERDSARRSMHVKPLVIAAFAAALLGTALSAQAPVSEMDTHINAARTAAGLDYRATFVNLCFAGANPAGARPGGAAPAGGRDAAAGGRAAAAAPGAGPGGGGGRGPAPTPDRATWYASPYKVF